MCTKHSDLILPRIGVCSSCLPWREATSTQRESKPAVEAQALREYRKGEEWICKANRKCPTRMQTGEATVENSMEVPQKSKNGTPFDPAILLLGLHPKNHETPIQKNLCTPMFIAAQFTIAKYWKPSKCPSANEWIQKLWYILELGRWWQHRWERSPLPLNAREIPS